MPANAGIQVCWWALSARRRLIRAGDRGRSWPREPLITWCRSLCAEFVPLSPPFSLALALALCALTVISNTTSVRVNAIGARCGNRGLALFFYTQRILGL